MCFVIMLAATPVAAQAPLVLGPSDDPVYSERVRAPDGSIVNCRPDPVEQNGQLVRRCVDPGSGAGSVQAGGLGAGPAIAGGVIFLGLIASDSSSGTSGTSP